jgi:hypothetical protein
MSSRLAAQGVFHGAAWRSSCGFSAGQSLYTGLSTKSVDGLPNMQLEKWMKKNYRNMAGLAFSEQPRLVAVL